MNRFRGSIFAALFVSSAPLLQAAPLTIHEWGTFTSFQDENGAAISGINVDDEPAPNFVYSQYVTRPLLVSHEEPFGLPIGDQRGFTIGGKGYVDPQGQVTLRLETPVLYIYPPTGTAPELIPPLSVHVEFSGGILSQFYPYAKFLDNDTYDLEKKHSALTWNNVKLGGGGTPVASDSAVWTTPRQVSAPMVTVNNSKGESESEKFLFYRGVAHLDSPMVTTETSDGTTSVSLPVNCAAYPFTQGWLVEIRPNGTCAFKSTDFTSREAGQSRILATLVPFQESDFAPTHLDELKSSMHAALVKNGLYDDEATAMLNTWQLSYFKSPGLRLFYIVPRQWTDKTLPLTVGGAESDITRVMIGRIEMISPFDRRILAQLRTGPAPDFRALYQTGLSELQKRGIVGPAAEPYKTGQKTLADLGITVPSLVDAYTQLGRFRQPLVLHEEAINPGPELKKFIQLNGLSLP